MRLFLFQGRDICTPEGRTCIEKNSGQNFSCSVNCVGMYADIQRTHEDTADIENHAMMTNIRGKGQEANRKKIEKLVHEYNAYKKSKLRNFKFNPARASAQFGEFSHNIFCSYYVFAKGEEQPPSTLRLVQIYLDTATFDEIERDEKVKFTAALGLVGGTMELLTGISIINGIEVVYYSSK